MLTHRILTDVGQLEALGPELEALLERARRREVAQTPTWLTTWWRSFGRSGRRLVVVEWRRDAELVGIAPLQLRFGFPLRTLELLGAEGPPGAPSGSYRGLPVVPGEEQQVASALSRLLATDEVGSWHELRLSALSSEDPMVPLLVESLADVGPATTEVTGEARFVRIPPSWDDYLASLAPAARESALGALGSFEAWTSGDAAFHQASTPDGLEEGLGILEELRSDGSAGTGGKAAGPWRPRFEFQRNVARALLGRGLVDLRWIRLRGQPLAAQLGTVIDGRVQIIEHAAATALPAGIRPDAALHLDGIRRAIQAGHSEYELPADAAPGDLPLGNEARPRLAVRLVRRSARTRAWRLARQGLGLARALWGGSPAGSRR